jgi:RHS repeat-associated protein
MVNIGSVIPAATRSGQSRFGVLRLRGSQYGRMTIRPYPPEGGTPNKDSGGVTRTHVYTYDDSGNMVHDENHAYGYDPENRLVLVRKSGPYGTLDYETITKYVYDGDHCIAEYNAYNQLKRKYIYGPCTDEPICLIDTMTSPAVTSYYHFDGLRSVVALTNSSGNTVEVYEYDVYGRPGATDASHPNRIMFAGREYDKETGLYYYRARYYNPQIGRFLQTDPIGYGDGMNWYAYCGNNPIVWADPAGLLDIKIAFYDGDEPYPPQYGSKHPWEERADDFAPWYFNMGSTKDVKTVLEAIKWGNENMGWDLHITDIYFYDHCAYDVGKNFGMEFGDEWLPAGGPYDRTMFDFCQELKDLTPDDCNLNFRQCYVARDPGVLSDLATWSQRRVTGCEGIIADLWPATERPGPDYTMLGDLWFADPKKLERGRVWRVGEPNQPY